MILKIALRNIRRNTRRSAMTLSTIAVGAMALLVFGAFIANMVAGYETLMIRKLGHLSVFQTGYFEFGTGNPAAYGISDHRRVMALMDQDDELKAAIRVASPVVTLYGIAGNFRIDTSRTVMGVGVVPADQKRMRQWNEYRVELPVPTSALLADDDPALGLIGSGLARMLGLCEATGVSGCRAPPPRRQRVDGAPSGEDFSELLPPGEADPVHAGLPRIDVLAATVGGAPNVVSLFVGGVEVQGLKELDDSYVGMHLSLAQKLLYGRSAPKVTGIVLQLHSTHDMDRVRQRLATLFQRQGLDLEVRDFTELVPIYKGVIGMFVTIFSFIAVIIGVIVMFSVVNTMSMSVMERINEIGTLRAMGVRRAGIRNQFLAEGGVLGAAGASMGLVGAVVVIFMVNRLGLTWTPPISPRPIPLKLMLDGQGLLVAGTWMGLVALATLAALLPARHAARMEVVDALRHV
ncbi:MAG TPA: FtsX-like permease family protein [Magnetospirillum sp.]|nr:FtsX-like permease family protein [Magnetospirillum sp.]